MKNKLFKTMFLVAMIIPMFVSVFAISYEELLARLDDVAKDITSMKEQYSDILNTYPEVIDSLSEQTKESVKNLADNLMAEDIKNTVKNLKNELGESTVENADKVLEAVEKLQDEATKLIEENKDVVEEVKSGYTDLSVSEIKQVVEKVTEIVESLGAKTDVTDTYDEMLQTIADSHTMFNEIIAKLETTIENNVDVFESALTKSLLKELLIEVKNKDIEAIIDTLIVALNNAEGGVSLKQELKELKTMAYNLKNKIMELSSLDEQDLLMFSDAQKANVASKIKDIEKDFVKFAKSVINNSAVDYLNVAMGLVYNESVDNMISYANKALDYFEQYKDTIDSLSVSMFVSKLPNNLKDLAKKAGLLVALGFIDTSDYNRNYITNNFKSEIESMKQYITDEAVNYMEHIKDTMENELDEVSNKDITFDEMKDSYRKLTGSRFTTLTNLKALKSRVDEEILTNHETIKNKLNSLSKLVYDMYNSAILDSIFYTIDTENYKKAEDKEYEYNSRQNYIVTNTFFKTNMFTKELGVPDFHKDIVSYNNVAGDGIKTGSEFTVELDGDSIYATFAVLGDVYADGRIDARDYMVIKNHIMIDEVISESCSIAADTYRDDQIDARDYMVIKNYIMNDVKISL